jgi:hypothetical protein
MMRWVVIEGYGGMYSVSDEGQVFSQHCMRFLKPGIASHGYPTVSLWCPDKGKAVTRTLHSLVAEGFLGPTPEGMEVRHDNGVRTDPRLSNLIYGTRTQNIEDAIRHGTWVVGRRLGSRLPGAARDFIQANAARLSLRAMARALGVTHQTVSRCLAEIGGV